MPSTSRPRSTRRWSSTWRRWPPTTWSAGRADHDVPARVRRRQPDADVEEVERLAARAQALAEGWDHPSGAPDPVDVDDDVPDDSVRGPHAATSSTSEGGRRPGARAAPRCWSTRRTRPRARAGRGPDRRGGDRGQPCRPAASGRATTRRRPAPRRSSGWSAAAPWRRSATRVDGLRGGRPGVRPAGGRRLRHPRRGPGRTGDAGARRRRPGDGRGAARGRGHRVVQRDDGGRAALGRHFLVHGGAGGIGTFAIQLAARAAAPGC